MRRLISVPLLTTLLLAGCVVAPVGREPDVVVAPPLPVIVEFDTYPYYYYGGFYYYYQDRDRIWRYSRYRGGPWTDLPHDRYPRELRYRYRDDDRYGRDRDGDRDYRR